MSSSTFIFLHYVCPSLGTILASATFSAPISSLNEALSHKALGDLNPMPWAFMTGNCLGWIAYSFMTKDPFVLVANVPGLIVSVWLNNGALKLQYYEQFEKLHRQNNFGRTNTSTQPIAQRSEENNNHLDTNELDRQKCDLTVPPLTAHEYWVLAIILIWIGILSGITFFRTTTTFKKEVIGLCVNVNLIVFYGAPLSTILTVLRSKDSKSIHRRTLGTTCMHYTLSYFRIIYFYAC